MFQRAIRRLAAHFTEPTFDRRRSFAGSIILHCRETAEDYSLIPTGGRGFYVAGSGGRYIGTGHGFTDAMVLVSSDARDAIRAFALTA